MALVVPEVWALCKLIFIIVHLGFRVERSRGIADACNELTRCFRRLSTTHPRHIITAVASQRAECFSEHVRLLLTVSLRQMKALSTEQVKQLWFASQELLVAGGRSPPVELVLVGASSFKRANWKSRNEMAV